VPSTANAAATVAVSNSAGKKVSAAAVEKVQSKTPDSDSSDESDEQDEETSSSRLRSRATAPEIKPAGKVSSSVIRSNSDKSTRNF